MKNNHTKTTTQTHRADGFQVYVVECFSTRVALLYDTVGHPHPKRLSSIHQQGLNLWAALDALVLRGLQRHLQRCYCFSAAHTHDRSTSASHFRYHGGFHYQRSKIISTNQSYAGTYDMRIVFQFHTRRHCRWRPRHLSFPGKTP